MHWEVLALRYGWQDRKAGSNFIHAPDPHDAPMPLDYFVWLVRSGARQIVVDTGFSRETLDRKGPGGGRHISRTVDEALRQAGCDPDAVDEVVITHLHYDHAGNLNLFPRARFHLQEREMAFATGRNMCFGCMRGAFEVDDVVRMVRALYAGRVVFHDGDREIAPGVSLHRVGGHTDGLQMVRVQTARGPLVLASDASHFYANLEREEPFPIVFDLGEMARGWRRARELAGGDESLIVPGHDPAVRRRYPPLAGSDGETVMLHHTPVHQPETSPNPFG
ncbi:N-acyl homoserine lactonase family protein [Enterovirga rhinocerotis]|uniref:Glyoxylase-like metal-dependent hydrolase (Beta-lactamase superfamily II) n=1 Tax=Enterovirga rhinocerotis TaxID=1339210 RepID=A0A4R7BR91_9HYPH|nr:N-acyl homoserine lactonase family protein [Enterovirga rhinocerotis]TDR88194.1 glyoxylase-like metal-dependent hydrolase (beta-lactamase superfamily II) [Enterovirga rhinocerotis]